MRTLVQYRPRFRYKTKGLTLVSLTIYMLVAGFVLAWLLNASFRDARIKRGEWIGTQMAHTHRTVQDFIDRHAEGIRTALIAKHAVFNGKADDLGGSSIQIAWTSTQGPSHIATIDQSNIEKIFQAMGIAPEWARSDLGDYQLILSVPETGRSSIASLLYITSPLQLRQSGNVDSLAIQAALRRLGTGSGVSVSTGIDRNTAPYMRLTRALGEAPAFIENPHARKAAGVLAMTNGIASQHTEDHLAQRGGVINGALLAQRNITNTQKLEVGSGKMFGYEMRGDSAIDVRFDPVFTFNDERDEIRFEKRTIVAPIVASNVAPLRNMRFVSDSVETSAYNARCVPGQISLGGSGLMFCDVSNRRQPLIHRPGLPGRPGQNGADGRPGEDIEGDGTVHPIPGLYWATWSATGETITDVHHVASSINDHAYRLKRQAGRRDWTRTVNDASEAATAFSARYVFLAYGTQYDAPLPPDFKTDGGVNIGADPQLLPLAEHFAKGWVKKEFDASPNARWEAI